MFVVVCVCVFPCRNSGDCLVLVLTLLHWLSTGVLGWLAMVFQTQKRGSWILGKERAGRVLASAISIVVRKEWTCKFCSELNVWTRWWCRRCYHDIPAGLRGKYRQAIAARTGECSTGSSTSSGEAEF